MHFCGGVILYQWQFADNDRLVFVLFGLVHSCLRLQQHQVAYVLLLTVMQWRPQTRTCLLQTLTEQIDISERYSFTVTAWLVPNCQLHCQPWIYHQNEISPLTCLNFSRRRKSPPPVENPRTKACWNLWRSTRVKIGQLSALPFRRFVRRVRIDSECQVADGY